MIFNIYIHTFSEIFNSSNNDYKPSDRINFSKIKFISEICDYFSETLKTNKNNVYIMNQGRILKNEELIKDLSDSNNLHIFYRANKSPPIENNYTTSLNTMTDIINSMINMYNGENNSLNTTISNNSIINNLTNFEYVSSEIINNNFNNEENRQKYSDKLLELQKIGFHNNDINLEALIISNGDLEKAINYIFENQ